MISRPFLLLENVDLTKLTSTRLFKAMAYIEGDCARSRRHFETGRWKTEPRLTLDDVRGAGQVATLVSICHRPRPTVWLDSTKSGRSVAIGSSAQAGLVAAPMDKTSAIDMRFIAPLPVLVSPAPAAREGITKSVGQAAQGALR